MIHRQLNNTASARLLDFDKKTKVHSLIFNFKKEKVARKKNAYAMRLS